MAFLLLAIRVFSYFVVVVVPAMNVAAEIDRIVPGCAYIPRFYLDGTGFMRAIDDNRFNNVAHRGDLSRCRPTDAEFASAVPPLATLQSRRSREGFTRVMSWIRIDLVNDISAPVQIGRLDLTKMGAHDGPLKDNTVFINRLSRDVKCSISELAIVKSSWIELKALQEFSQCSIEKMIFSDVAEVDFKAVYPLLSSVKEIKFQHVSKVKCSDNTIVKQLDEDVLPDSLSISFESVGSVDDQLLKCLPKTTKKLTLNMDLAVPSGDNSNVRTPLKVIPPHITQLTIKYRFDEAFPVSPEAMVNLEKLFLIPALRSNNANPNVHDIAAFSQLKHVPVHLLHQISSAMLRSRQLQISTQPPNDVENELLLKDVEDGGSLFGNPVQKTHSVLEPEEVDDEYQDWIRVLIKKPQEIIFSVVFPLPGTQIQELYQYISGSVTIRAYDPLPLENGGGIERVEITWRDPLSSEVAIGS